MLYTPLNSTDGIRLLRLHGRVNSTKTSSIQQQNDTTITCELYSLAFDTAKEKGYSALSYAWGSASDLSPISVNGLEVLVTHNLYLALESLREDTDIILWVDAICINQNDFQEKNHQVAFMGDIYAYAQMTKVWLGPADNTSAATVTKITEIGRHISDSGDDEEFQLLAYHKVMDVHLIKDQESNTEKLVDDMFQEALLEPEASIQFLKGLHVLLSRPYWSRVW